MQTIVNLGSAGSLLNGRNGSTTSADSNDALFLDWPGDNSGNYVYLPGVAGNYLSVPDEAALDITGDIDIRAQVALDDWTAAVAQPLLTKWLSTGDQRSYRFDVRTDGALQLQWSETGAVATIRTAVSTVAATVTDESSLWVRVTLDVDNGASGRDIVFYTSSDGSSWAQLGSTVTQSTVTSIFSGTGEVQVGLLATGKFYRAIVKNGINGTTVLDVDTSKITSGSNTSFTAVTGQTVTINRGLSGRKSVAVVSPVWLFGTDDYMEVADNALLNFGVNDPFTVLVVLRQWATPTNFGRYISKWDYSVAGAAGWDLDSNGTALQALGYVDDGPDSAQQNSGTFTSGAINVLSLRLDRSAATLTPGFNNTFASPSSTSNIGSLTNANPVRIGRSIGAGGYQDFELIGVAVYRRVLTAGEIAALITYYQNRLS